MAKILENIKTDLSSEFYGVWLEKPMHEETKRIMTNKGYKNKSEYLRAAIREFNDKNGR